MAMHCIARQHVSKITACPSALWRQTLSGLPAEKRYVGVRTRDVKPTGATTPYAAPELLHSLQCQWEGAEDDEEFVMINGPAADIWSFACICYEMLTGDLPFLPDQTPATCAPAVVVEEVRPTWEEYESIIKGHQLWVSLNLNLCFCAKSKSLVLPELPVLSCRLVVLMHLLFSGC